MNDVDTLVVRKDRCALYHTALLLPVRSRWSRYSASILLALNAGRQYALDLPKTVYAATESVIWCIDLHRKPMVEGRYYTGLSSC
jgi:hypothetical protein